MPKTLTVTDVLERSVILQAIMLQEKTVPMTKASLVATLKSENKTITKHTKKLVDQGLLTSLPPAKGKGKAGTFRITAKGRAYLKAKELLFAA